MESNLTGKAKELFFSAMCRSHPFMDLLQTAYQLLGWPVLVGDDAANVILQLPDKTIGSAWYDALLEERRINPESYVLLLEAIQKIYNPAGAEIQMIPGEDERYPLQAYLNVRVYGKTAAQVIFYVPKTEVTQEERAVLQLLLQALTAECRKTRRSDAHIFSSERLQHSMRLLVEGRHPDETLQHHAQNLEQVLSGDYVLIVTLLEDSARKEELEPFYMEQIGKHLSHTLTIPYEGNLVTLCGGISGSSPAYLNPLMKFLGTCFLVAGVTMRFSGGLLRLKPMYEQALLTARLGHTVRPKEFLFEYDALIPLQVFIPALKDFSVEAFLHPSIIEIMKYDEKNGTEYLKTLRAYLVAAKSNKETIRLLSVHPNTLVYRLTKIKDLFDIDFLDGKLTITLLTNVLMLVVARPDLLPMLDVSTPIIEASPNKE